jgi:hypothetical protein
MGRRAQSHHAQVAICAARDGEEGAQFHATDGLILQLRRAD